MSAKRRVVLTGAAGSSPSGCSRRSTSAGTWCRSTSADRRATASPSPASSWRTSPSPIRNAYRQHFRGADAVIHCGFVRAPGMTADTWQDNSDAKFQAEHANVALAYNVYRVALEAGVRRVVVCSSNHASDYYERLVWDGRVDMVTPEMPPRSDNWYGWSKASYELLGFVFATGKVDGRKLEVVQWRIGGPRDNDLDTIKPGDIPTMHRALGAYLSARDQTQQAIRMVETEDITDDQRHPVPDRLRHQRQHAPVLEPGQREAEDRLPAGGRQPGELRRQDRRDRPRRQEIMSVVLGTATPGGGFPVYGDAVAAVLNEVDPSLGVTTAQHEGQHRERAAARGRPARPGARAGRGRLRGAARHRPRRRPI